MNKRFTLATVAAIAVVSSGLARADDAPITRAQVIADLNAARASGELAAMAGEDSGSFWLAQRIGRPAQTRQQVVAEAVLSRGTGHCTTLTGEDSGSMCLASLPFTSQRTRADVLAEVIDARQQGVLYALVGEDSGSAHLSRRGTTAPVIYAGPNVGDRREASADPVVHHG